MPDPEGRDRRRPDPCGLMPEAKVGLRVAFYLPAKGLVDSRHDVSPTARRNAGPEEADIVGICWSRGTLSVQASLRSPP